MTIVIDVNLFSNVQCTCDKVPFEDDLVEMSADWKLGINVGFKAKHDNSLPSYGVAFLKINLENKL